VVRFSAPAREHGRRSGSGALPKPRQRRRSSQARTAVGLHSNPSPTPIRRRQVSLDPVVADKDAVSMEVLRALVSSSSSSSGAGDGSDGVAAGGRRGGRQDRTPPPPRRRPLPSISSNGLEEELATDQSRPFPSPSPSWRESTTTGRMRDEVGVLLEDRLFWVLGFFSVLRSKALFAYGGAHPCCG
jgi:hypothetical protein